MSSYRDFISDFPGRCAELLRTYEEDAHSRGREVTLMLAIGAPSIIIPYGRLVDPRDEKEPHPSRDHHGFADAKRKFDQCMDSYFLQSDLWNGAETHSWRFGKLRDISGEPDSWPELIHPQPMTPQKTTKAVISHLRNALAHGNIFMKGYPNIATIVFLSRVSQEVYRFNYLCVSPHDFRTFLFNWLKFFSSLPATRLILED